MFKVSKVKISGDLKDAVYQAVEKIGGFGKFIKTGDAVLLKPNFNTADPSPASSDLKFIKAAIELIYEYGAKTVTLGESSMISLNTRKAMEKIGVFKLTEMDPPAEVYVFDEHNWVRKQIPDARYLKNVSVPDILDRADKLVLLPCLKTHRLAQFTGSLKLSVGLMKPSERICLHLRRLQEKVAELNKIINPDLIIMDARKCFIVRGPDKGEVREPDLILASDDRVALDVEGIKIIQSYKGNSLSNLDPWGIAQIKLAAELGLGAGSEKDYEVILG